MNQMNFEIKQISIWFITDLDDNPIDFYQNHFAFDYTQNLLPYCCSTYEEAEKRRIQMIGLWLPISRDPQRRYTKNNCKVTELKFTSSWRTESITAVNDIET